MATEIPADKLQKPPKYLVLYTSHPDHPKGVYGSKTLIFETDWFLRIVWKLFTDPVFSRCVQKGRYQICTVTDKGGR